MRDLLYRMVWRTSYMKNISVYICDSCDQTTANPAMTDLGLLCEDCVRQEGIDAMAQEAFSNVL